VGLTRKQIQKMLKSRQPLTVADMEKGSSKKVKIKVKVKVETR